MYFCELNEIQSIEYGDKMTNFSNFVTKILVKLLKKLVIFTVAYLFVSEEAESFEYGVQMTHFCTIISNILVKTVEKWAIFTLAYLHDSRQVESFYTTVKTTHFPDDNRKYSTVANGGKTAATAKNPPTPWKKKA